MLKQRFHFNGVHSSGIFITVLGTLPSVLFSFLDVSKRTDFTQSY